MGLCVPGRPTKQLYNQFTGCSTSQEEGKSKQTNKQKQAQTTTKEIKFTL